MPHAGEDMSPTDPLQTVMDVCPPDITTRLRQISAADLSRIEEIRLRLGQPVQLCGAAFDAFLGEAGGLTRDAKAGLLVRTEHLQRLVQAVTQSSLYAVEDELRRGFVTMLGGHRVGLAGRAVLGEGGHVRTLRAINAANLRIAKAHHGVATPLRPYLHLRTEHRPCSVLLLSPPQCGKTTLLRDLARQWSVGEVDAAVGPMKVAVIDERSEIAGCIEGKTQFALGPRTDVLDACPKAEGLLMAIRSLSPDIVVTDEIGREADAQAILEAAHAGVAVLASAHASSLEEWRARPHMAQLYDAHAFARYVVLSRRHGPCTVEMVLDDAGKPIWQRIGR